MWKKITAFDPDFGNPPEGINLFGGGDKSTVEERRALIQKAHVNGTHHYWYCGLNSCPSVAISHQTDHNLCRENFCSFINNHHFKNNHLYCNSFWCSDRYWMDKAHSQGSHSPVFCNTESCPDIARSHVTDHSLCKPSYCDTIRTHHNVHNTDHSLCAEYWCDSKQNIIREQEIKKLHDANDHSQCPRRLNEWKGCSVIKDRHQNIDHSMCHELGCPTGKGIDMAHARGEHSTQCSKFTCGETAEIARQLEQQERFEKTLRLWNTLDKASE